MKLKLEVYKFQSFELTNDRLNKVIDKYHQNQWGFRKSYIHLETEMRH